MRATIFCWTICLVILSGCNKHQKDSSYYLDIKNNASHDIYFYVAAKGLLYVYPDTAIENPQPGLRLIKPGNAASWASGQPWELFFGELPVDTVSLYVFHADTLSKYSWKEVCDGYKVAKRYDLSLTDLETANFMISYP